MPRRLATRCRCSQPGAETTTTRSQRRSPPVSNSSGMSSTTTGSRRACVTATKRRSACRTIGCKISSRRRSAAGRPKTRSANAWRSIAPLGERTSGNTDVTAATAKPPFPISRCTAASASKTGTPSRRSTAAAVLFPIPIEPVRPKTITAARGSSARPHANCVSPGPRYRTKLRSRAGLDATTCRDHRPLDSRAAAPPPRAKSRAVHTQRR